MVFTDLHLYTEEQAANTEQLFTQYASNINYVYYLPPEIAPVFIQHAGFEDRFERDGVTFIVKQGYRKKKLHLFFSLFREVKVLHPSVVMMHGLIQPVQILLARFIFNKETKIIIQNHAERPYRGFWRLVQKWADRCVSAYLFVSKEQAVPWIKAGIIKDPAKVHEVMEGSTAFTVKDKIALKTKFKCHNTTVFLWVGRLDRNKDPLTILEAFAAYTKQHSEVKLWMIYHTAELLEEVKRYIAAHALEACVELVGKVEHRALEEYYNAADYFLLGSHYEGSGYALCEAMACGCVPVVTEIPSFKHMLNNGDCGYLFKAGHPDDLLSVLNRLTKNDLELYRNKVIEKFNADLSFEAIAGRVSSIAMELSKK